MNDEKTLRVLDTGVLEGCLNIATGQAIIESHQGGEVPDTLRFLRFPPTALVGRHQALGQEIDLVIGSRDFKDLSLEFNFGYFWPGNAFAENRDNAFLTNLKASYKF